MGRTARRNLSTEIKGVTEQETARRTRTGAQLEETAGGYLRGEGTQETEGIRRVFDAYRDNAANRLAITGNRAGYGAYQGELARDESRGVAGQIEKNRARGTQILSGLHSGTAPYLANLYGQRTGMANQPSFWDQFAGNLTGGIAGVASAYAG